METKKYHIPFSGLTPGKHQFTVDVTDSFFAQYPDSEIQQGKVKVEIELDKKINMGLMTLTLNGSVALPCDRCLDDLNIVIDNSFDLIVRDSDDDSNPKEDEEFIKLTKGETQIDLSPSIYEFIYLSIPMQRLCENTAKKTCNPEVIKKLNQISAGSKGGNEPIDPRWEALKNIKLN
jgi:uncharacterized protein